MLRPIIASIILVLIMPLNAFASVILMQDRMIFSPGENSASLQVIGDQYKPYLLQSWVSEISDGVDKEVPSLSVTPALVVVPQKQTQFIRVLYQGTGLPTDRETRVWLNIQAIAAQPDDGQGKNTLTPSYVQTISLFYRPKSLLNINANEAVNQLEWKITKKEANQYSISVKNPSPFNILISGAFVVDRGNTTSNVFGSTTENPGYIKPFESISFNIFKVDNTPFKEPIDRREIWFITKNDAGFSLAYYATISDMTIGKFSLFTPPPKSKDSGGSQEPASQPTPNSPIPPSVVPPTTPPNVVPQQIGQLTPR